MFAFLPAVRAFAPSVKLMTDTPYIESEFYQLPKHGQPVCGDVFLSRKDKLDGRVTSVLADGLGSGIKAGVLATLTSTMALRFVREDVGIREAARIIMDTLPVCKERKVGYSTFTIVDVDATGATRVMEHDNPPCLLLRAGVAVPIDWTETPFTPRRRVPGGPPRLLREASFQLAEEDRLIFCSDGVVQAGLGRPRTPLGWTLPAVRDCALGEIRQHPAISARELARRLVLAAIAKDDGVALDDVTCGVLYFRRPRRLLVVTGPPYARDRDALIARQVERFPGTVVIAGGTTADILARELQRDMTPDPESLDPDVPPVASMPGVALVTEGAITLRKVAELLEEDAAPDSLPRHGAARLLRLLLNHDAIQFVVGTRVNQAHQDPDIPVEFDLRRNIIRRIAGILEERHRKDVRLSFM